MLRPLLRVLVVVAVFVVMSGCSSSDPTTSDECAALEQELAQTKQELAQAETHAFDYRSNAKEFERKAAALQAELASYKTSGVSQDVGHGLVPDDVVALIDEWKQATDSSIVDLYTASGFHLYGDERFEGDDIAAHLTNSAALAVGHEGLTPLLLVADEPGRWVVTQGMENTVGRGKYPSGISWEIVEDSAGDLKIAQSAWFKVTG